MPEAYKVDRDVAVLTLDNPPVNGLGLGVRRALIDGLLKAQADAAVKAIVIAGSGKGFSGGADIREFNTPKMFHEPSLRTVISAIEASDKPVIAAIHGTCLGGGLELALGCHYRVAAANAQVGFPEVKLGLLPGGGGTQRFPRVVGLETALNLIVSGEMIPAKALAKTKFFDRVSADENSVAADSLGLAREVASKPIPRIRELAVDAPLYEGFLQFARNTARTVAKSYPAPIACIDALAAAVTKPFDEGLKVEGELFLKLLETPESKALRHAFFSERAAAKIVDVPDDTLPRPIASVAIVGAGTMGAGIAMSFANVGIPVTILEMKQEALDKGLTHMKTIWEGSLKKGKLKPEDLQKRLGLVKGTLSFDDFSKADLVIEAVFEDLKVKQSVFEKLDQVMKPGAILATNTSTLDVDVIAKTTKRPGDVLGLHFFSPANVMKLLEIVRGKETKPDVLATSMALAKTLKKTGVVARVCDGFIGNRMLEEYFRQAGFLLDEGALPAQVDRAAEDFGFAMGPFRVSDLAGNDIATAIRRRKLKEHPEMLYSKTADMLAELNRLGQKTSAGWYDYAPGDRKAKPSKLVDDMIVNCSANEGVTRRKISDQEIVDRLVFALVNEGAKLLAEGIAQRASDIDMVYLTGYGFPIFRGGPMFYADSVGLLNVMLTMKRLEKTARYGQFWKPAPLLQKLAAQGETFETFNSVAVAAKGGK